MLWNKALILSALKWGAVTVLILGIGYGINWAWNYHLDQIDLAVRQAKLELAAEITRRVNERERELLEDAEEQRQSLEQQLIKERLRVRDLRRKLLIEHDLDRLLQSKPEMILERVNEGTREYFKELEDVTQ